VQTGEAVPLTKQWNVHTAGLKTRDGHFANKLTETTNWLTEYCSFTKAVTNSL